VRVEIAEESWRSLPEYASISIAFTVSEVLEPITVPAPGRATTLRTRAVAASYVKDYDAYTENSPLSWPTRFDVTAWGFLAAYVGGERVGGAVVIPPTGGVEVLSERTDAAVLWDLRVAPAHRRSGVASALMPFVESWARQRGTRVLTVETQNNNVAACRFYERNGFELDAVKSGAYPALPHEIQLLWYKELSRASTHRP
jgi:streptothricin acetyltransferase